MKKIIAYILLLAMCVALFAGCGEKPGTTAPSTNPSTAPTNPTPTEPAVDKLENAKKFLFNMYKNDAVVTRKDYSVVASLLIGDDEFKVAWTTDVTEDIVKIVADEANNAFKVQLTTSNLEDIDYVLTATISDADGKTASVSFNHQIPAAVMTPAQIVEMAYTLGSGDVLEGPFELTGTITEINTPWSPDYQNISVVIVVGDMTDKPILCYRLAGEGAETLAVGDKITVSGNFKNYNGTIEFDAGCQLLSVVKSIDQTALLEASYALAPGSALPEKIALMGVIVSIDTEYSEQYQNITVTIVCDGKTDMPIKCYRLKGEGAATLAVGQEIAVYGTMKNYQHSSGDCEIEFDAGCQLLTMAEFAELFNPVPPVAQDPVEPDEVVVPETLAEQIAEAAAQENNVLLPYESTMTGVIGEDFTASTQTAGTYKFTLTDSEGNSVLCYWVAIEGEPAAGDTITVTGNLTAYNGNPQFTSAAVTSNLVKADGGETPVDPDVDPDVDPEGETKVMLYNADADTYMTGEAYLYNNKKWEMVLGTEAEALVLVMKSEGEFVSFQTADGKYLMADGTNVMLVTEAGEHTRFVLEEATGGYLIRCATATFNGKPQYLEIYSGYLTVYGYNPSNAAIYVFELITVE